MSHTPGPWEVRGPVWTWVRTAGDPYGHGEMHIADVRGWGHLTGSGACALSEDDACAIQNANARLIAAAPDLLVALKDIVEDLEARWDMRDPRTNPGIVDCVSRAKEAIAKAAKRGIGSRT